MSELRLRDFILEYCSGYYDIRTEVQFPYYLLVPKHSYFREVARLAEVFRSVRIA